MKTELSKRIQQVIGPIIAISLLSYFIYHIIQGERGLLSWRRMTQKIDLADQRLQKLQTDQGALEQRVHLMRPNSLDPDMLDEQARDKLNFARKDEIIIRDEELK
jgi:cell division protein FtsB